MTPEQQQRAQAWSQVFPDGPATLAVFDDLTVFANALPESQQAGAARMLLYVLLRRGALKRAERRQKGKA